MSHLQMILNINECICSFIHSFFCLFIQVSITLQYVFLNSNAKIQNIFALMNFVTVYVSIEKNSPHILGE